MKFEELQHLPIYKHHNVRDFVEYAEHIIFRSIVPESEYFGRPIEWSYFVVKHPNGLSRDDGYCLSIIVQGNNERRARLFNTEGEVISGNTRTLHHE